RRASASSRRTRNERRARPGVRGRLAAGARVRRLDQPLRDLVAARSHRERRSGRDHVRAARGRADRGASTRRRRARLGPGPRLGPAQQAALPLAPVLRPERGDRGGGDLQRGGRRHRGPAGATRLGPPRRGGAPTASEDRAGLDAYRDEVRGGLRGRLAPRRAKTELSKDAGRPACDCKWPTEDAGERRFAAAYPPPPAKSSGVTLSRKSLNFSTTSSVSSTSCSNSIADSSITDSAAKIGALVRTARANASDGRESISISRPLSCSVIDA